MKDSLPGTFDLHNLVLLVEKERYEVQSQGKSRFRGKRDGVVSI